MYSKNKSQNLEITNKIALSKNIPQSDKRKKSKRISLQYSRLP